MRMLVTAIASLTFALVASAHDHDNEGHVRWTRNGAPTESMIKGGPWTLEQSGAALNLKSAGYCDSTNTTQIGNPGVERMQPYYFPTVVGHGKHLQGYFDWRPKDIDEAVVAASSDDGGFTWTFQQEALELRKTCPTPLADPDGDKDFTTINNGDNGDDDGQGHAYVIAINGHTYLYTLIRATGHIDSDQLAIHELHPLPGQPLNGAPAMSDAPTDSSGSSTVPLYTSGLLDPDGILGVVPGTGKNSPLKVIYEQKILKGDTSFPKAQQCNTYWADYYKAHGGLPPNDDVTYLRLAETMDGIVFKDMGPLKGLNDPTTVSATGTRWLATAGTVIKLEGGRYGLFFSGGNCIDGDSDAFHYIGYAESDGDLTEWTVVNGLENPIASVFPAKLSVDPATGVPATGPGSASITIPSHLPVVGETMGFFAGRVYAPSATRYRDDDVTVVFAGYHTQKPKNGLGDYRTIGRVSLHSSQELLIVGNE